MTQQITEIYQLARIAQSPFSDTVLAGLVMLQTLAPANVAQRQQKPITAIMVGANKALASRTRFCQPGNVSA